ESALGQSAVKLESGDSGQVDVEHEAGVIGGGTGLEHRFGGGEVRYTKPCDAEDSRQGLSHRAVVFHDQDRFAGHGYRRKMIRSGGSKRKADLSAERTSP